MPDLSTLFAFELGIAEMAIRGTVIYWGVFLMLRIAGRRDIGSLTMADMLVLLLVADALGDAMSGSSASLGDGLVVAAVLVGWSYIIDRLKYHVPALGALLEPRRICLIRDGRLMLGHMHRACISRDELFEQLRLKGVANVREVYRAYLEAHGDISVVTRSAVTRSASLSGSASTLQE